MDAGGKGGNTRKMLKLQNFCAQNHWVNLNASRQKKNFQCRTIVGGQVLSIV